MSISRRIFVSRRNADDHAREEFADAVERRHGARWEFDVFPTDGRWDGDWRLECEKRIRACDAMVLLVGEKTAESTPVEWEVRTALAFGKPVVALVVGSGGAHPMPAALVEANIEPVPVALEEAAAVLDELLVDAALFRNSRHLHEHPKPTV